MNRRSFLVRGAAALAALVVAPVKALAGSSVPAAIPEAAPVSIEVDWVRAMVLRGSDTGLFECRWRVTGGEWQKQAMLFSKSNPLCMFTEHFGFDASALFDEQTTHSTVAEKIAPLEQDANWMHDDFGGFPLVDERGLRHESWRPLLGIALHRRG